MTTPTLTQSRKNRNQVVVPSSFRLTKHTRQTLATLAEYFCVRTNDAALIIRDRTPNENDKRTLRFTLKLLHKAGLANRIPYLDLERESGGVAYVYGLSDKGVRYCRDLYDGRMKTFDDHSQRTLDHELEISLFHIALKKLCAKRNLTLYWQQDDLKCTVNPDAMFAITDPSKPEGKNTFYYFLEIERAKMGHYIDGESSIMRKLGKFYEYYGTEKCRKEWGVEQFRVVVVQRTADKRYNLLAALNRQFNHRMFWLTTEQLYKEDIGAAIFKTPKDHPERSYSFFEA